MMLPAPDLSQRSLRWLMIHLVPPAVVLTIAVLAMQSHVCGTAACTPEVEPLGGVSFAERLYHGISLFALGGLDMGMPRGSVEPWALWALWFCYFASPLMTIAVIAEGVVAAFGVEILRFRGLRDHLVVEGSGNTARRFIAAARADQRWMPITVVDRVINAERETALLGYPRVRVIRGTLADKRVRTLLHCERARAVAVLTSDEAHNLDAAAAAAEMRVGTGRSRVLVRVADPMLATDVMPDETLAARLLVFSGHTSTARQLVHDVIAPALERTAEADTLVIAGFGRFGQAALAALMGDEVPGAGQRGEPGKGIERLVLIDLDAELSWSRFKICYPEEACGIEPELISGDLGDPRTWRPLIMSLNLLGERLVVAVCTDDSLRNLRTVLELRRRFPGAGLLAPRVDEETPFARAVCDDEEGPDIALVDQRNGLSRDMEVLWQRLEQGEAERRSKG